MADRFSENWLSGGKSLNSDWYSGWVKRLDDEEQKKKEQEILQAQQDQAKKTEQDSKPWYEKAANATGDWLAGAGKNIVSGVEQGAAKVADVAVKGGAVIGQIGDDLSGRSAAIDKQNQEQNAADIKRIQEIGKSLKDPNVSDADKAKLREELSAVANNKPLESTAQKNVDSATQIRDVIKSGKDVNGENFTGSKDIGLQDIQNDPKQLAALAGEGLDVGLSATQFINPTQLLRGGATRTVAKEGADTALQTGLKIGAKDTAERVVRAGDKGLTTGQALKVAGKDSALYGGLDAVAGTADTYGETGDLGKSLEAGVQQGLTSAATQGLLDVGGHVVGKTIGGKKDAEAKALADAADQANKAKEATAVSDIAASLDNPLRDVNDKDLMKQIEDFQAGKNRTGDTQTDYQTYQSLKDEMSARERKAYYDQGGKTPAEAQKALDDLEAGKNIPETAYKPSEPVKSLDEVLTHPDIPQEIKSAANEVADDRMVVDNQLGRLMSPETKAAETSRLDENYSLELRQLNQKYGDPLKPGSASGDVRFQMAKEKLDNQYKDSMAELDMMEAKDADEVAKYTGIRDQLASREQNIIADTRQMMQSAPDQFKEVDQVELDAYKKSLEDQLNTAKRFGDSKEIVAEAATSPNPAKSLDSNPDGKAAVRANLVESTNNLEGFKNTSAVRQSMLGLLTPSKNLEAMGLRDLADNVMTADARQQLANKADFEKLVPIAKALQGNKQIQKQIVEYLEGSRKELSATDTQTAQMIRDFLDEKRDLLKEQGFDTIDDYFPHMFDKNNDGVQKLFKGKTTGDINFGNLKQRVSDSDDFSKEITDVLATYSQGLNKKLYLEPALKPLQELSNYEKISTLEAKWVDSYIDQLKNNKRSNIEEGFNNIVSSMMQKAGKEGDGNYYRSLLGGQRMMSAVATMGINPGTALRNMTQMVNTVAGIGPKWSSVGLKRGTQALMEGKGSPAYKEMAEAGVFSGGVSKNYNADLDQFDSNIRGLKGRSNGVANKMMIMVSASDSFLRAQAYWGAKAKAISKGMSEADAMKFAREKVVDTQFITSKVDMPTALNGPGMRSLTQLATFSAKQAEFLADLGIKTVRKDGKWHLDAESAGRIIAAGGAAGLATAALEPTIGFNKEEWIPFYSNIAPFIPGSDKDTADALYRSPLVTLLTGDGKSKMGLVEAIQKGDIGEWFKDQSPAIIPGGTQIKKTVEGIDTTTSGVSRNDKGNVRYLQDMGVDESIKAALFGQYSTEAGRNWIKEGFPTLSESQTTSLAGKDRSTQEQYTEYYAAAKKAGSGRQDVYDQIKTAAANGDTNKAARLGAEYNDKVTKAMSEYWKSNDTLPEDLKKSMLSDVYINVSNVVKNNSKED